MVYTEPPKTVISQCVCVCALSCIRLFATSRTITHQQ